jgi:maltooligosyltrehalose synthase
VPADVRDRIEALVDPITDAVENEDFAGDIPRLRRRLDRIDDAVTAATGGQLPDDDRAIADLLAALSCLRLRDIHLTQASAERTAAAQALWLHLWRHAPAQYAPTIAALLATTAYLRRDGATAGAIVERDPQPTRLSQLVRALHRNGIDTSTVLPGLADKSRELRTELTVQMPGS